MAGVYVVGVGSVSALLDCKLGTVYSSAIGALLSCLVDGYIFFLLILEVLVELKLLFLYFLLMLKHI